MPTLLVGIDARKAKSGAATAERAFDKTTKAAKKTDKAVQKLDRDMQKTGKTAGTMKRAFVSAFAGLSAFMILRDITKTVADFGVEMSTLSAVTGASIDQMAAFEEQARALGSSTRFSATEAAEGMTFLARAGFEANEVLAAIPATLDLAIAGAIGLGEAADIASNVLSQFNMAADETGRVGDILVKTANSANTNVLQLAEALKLAGPVAGALNISLEETAAAIGVLGDSGIQASLAGTNLRGVISALLGPTTKAEEVIKDMGLSIDDLNPATNSIIDIFKKFRDANLDATDALHIFGRRNISAALIFASNTDKLGDLTKANEDAKDTAKEAAKIMQDNLAGSFKSLRSTVDEAWHAVGDKGFTGALRDMVDTTRDAIRILLGMQAGEDGVSVAAKALAGAIRGVVTGLIALLALKTVIFFQGLVSGVLGLTSAMKALRLAMSAHPILLIATAAAAASTALAIFIGRTEAATVGVRSLNLVTKELVTNINKFAEAQKLIEKGMMFGRAEDEAEGARRQITVLEDVLFDLKKELKEGEGGDIWKNFFALKAVGVDIDDFKSNVDSMSETMQNALGESTLLYKIPLEDAIVAVESALKGMTEETVNAGLAFDTIGKDDIKTLVEKAVAAKEAEEAEKRLNDIKKEGKASLDAYLVSLMNERVAFDQGNEEKELAAALQHAVNIATESGAEINQAYIQSIADEVIGLQELRQAKEDDAKKTLEKQVEDEKAAAARRMDAFENERIAQMWVSPWVDAFEDIITQTESVKDAFESLYKTLAKMALQQFFLGPTQNFLAGLGTSLFAAKGAVFDSTSNAVPFAKGGIVSSPTLFPFADGGKVGLMGEAGPEAVVPLARTSSNELGIKVADSGGGGGGSRMTTVNQYITTTDADSFRKSRRQIANDTKKGIG